MKNRKKFTIVAMINLTWYCIVCLVLSALNKTVSDTLTSCWFTAWTVELALLCGIKLKNKGE